ncbi:MAG: hypothetical protein IAE82_14655 [Opitutaceae bacterium]|nr:hypothetical protein [Opitutaceae bacterium]
MKLRNYLTILSIFGGLAFGVASASAHCGTCGAGDKKEHAACPADCQKECCKDKKKEGCTDCKRECTDGEKKCAEGCTKECCKDKETKKEG